jgi:hypothetical protein
LMLLMRGSGIMSSGSCGCETGLKKGRRASTRREGGVFAIHEEF